jgi:pyruvate,water dikinase
MKFIRFFSTITIADQSLVGGKNASLGEMTQALNSQGIKIPAGFAVTTKAYWHHLEYNNLLPAFNSLLQDISRCSSLAGVAEQIRNLITQAPLPQDLADEIGQAYRQLLEHSDNQNGAVAVRSSAIAEDLATASFAGQQESYLSIETLDQALIAYKNCLASLFTERALLYRQDHSFNHHEVALSVGIQKMVSVQDCPAGVAFSLEPETGHKDIITINASYGLGQAVVQGVINPDEYRVHKPTLAQNFCSIISKQLGSKEKYIRTNTYLETPKEKQELFCLSNTQVLAIARAVAIIENYYSHLNGHWTPVDIEWAFDARDGQLYILQARPETVHAQSKKKCGLTQFKLEKVPSCSPLVTGHAIGSKITTGIARVMSTLDRTVSITPGDIIITSMTDPDWLPVLRQAGGIVTDKGGRTCHAAIVARELGIPAVIGTENGTQIIIDNQAITLDCASGSVGNVYAGHVAYSMTTQQLESLPGAPVPLMLNLARPEMATDLASLPVSGVGLARLEFIIADRIKIHPLALSSPDTLPDPVLKEYIATQSRSHNNNSKRFFVDTLAEAIATLAAPFYPRPVIVRLTDFKSNEYRNLMGGEFFEPHEENPMIGFRGAARYSSEQYRPAFALECQALKKVREEIGLTNVKIMVPFVRTLQEARQTVLELEKNGLIRDMHGLELYMMVEIPSNVLLLEEFSEYFDGFSIGSNDLTQLTLGVDRDSSLVSGSFDERDPAVKKLLELAIATARQLGKPIGICGQAPSDFPDLASWLIEQGISSLSLNPDSVIPFLLNQKAVSLSAEQACAIEL